MINQLGLYIHIPFCVKKCGYCDFLSGPASDTEQKVYVQALLQEIKRKSILVKGHSVSTIFIGGGTPSCLPGQDIYDILQSIYDNYKVRETAEITIEANPGTLDQGKLMKYREAGVNRLSLGLQSACNKELKVLGRIHTFEDFITSFDLARECGFENINIDLMSGLPGQNLKDWENTLQKVIQFHPEHISAYSLIIEEGTPFYIQYGQRGESILSEETDREIYQATKEVLMSAGYERYEISNYAKIGKECIHNLGYWKRTPYIGMGLGASSLWKETRYVNIENIEEYLKNENSEKIFWKESETLTKEQQMEEFMFLGLRMSQGVDLREFYQKFAVPIEKIYGEIINKLVDQSLIIQQKDRIFLTDYGMDISNYVFQHFLL